MAEDKVQVPEGVTTSANDDQRRKEHHEDPRAEFIQKTDGAKDIYAQFGVANHQQLVELVKSNPIIAAQLADAYVSKEEVSAESLAAAGVIRNPNAPQQDNITGDLDRTGPVATKIQHPTDSDAKPAILNGEAKEAPEEVKEEKKEEPVN